jgi:hypothetical protein
VEVIDAGSNAVQNLDRFPLQPMIGPELVEARDRIEAPRGPLVNNCSLAAVRTRRPIALRFRRFLYLRPCRPGAARPELWYRLSFTTANPPGARPISREMARPAAGCRLTKTVRRTGVLTGRPMRASLDGVQTGTFGFQTKSISHAP